VTIVGCSVVRCLGTILLVLAVLSPHICWASAYIDDCLTLGDGVWEGKYKYEIKLTIMNLSGTNITLVITYPYFVRIEEVNSTHVHIIGGRVGEVETSIKSSDWKVLCLIHLWMGSNVTNTFNLFATRSVNTVIRKDELPLLSSVFRVPIIRKVGGGCGVFRLEAYKFKAVRYFVEPQGEAVYECSSGILLYYSDYAVTRSRIGGDAVLIKRELKVELLATNILGKIGEPCSREELAPITEQLNTLTYVLVGLTSVLAATVAYMLIKIRKTIRKN